MFQSQANHSSSSSERAAASPARAPSAGPQVDPNLKAGAKLAEARRQLGLSIEQVSERIKVGRDYLLALEAMNMKLLPGRAYTVAFLRSYAQLVGLDAKDIVAQFQAESALAREDVAPQIRNPDSKPRKERPWLAALLVGLAVAGFVAWQALGNIVGDRQAPAAVEIADGIAAIDAPPAVPGLAPAVTVVEIRPTVDAWLEVRGADGTTFISGIVPVGKAFRAEIGADQMVYARDGGAFELWVDGKLIGALGEKGAPVLGRKVDALVDEAVPVPPGEVQGPTAS